MNTSANPQRKHLDALDGIRSFACLEIFCCHCLWGGGALGVSLFLVLSGFLLTYRYLSQDAAAALPSATPSGLVRFAWKRLSKLYPLHMITMVIAIVIQLSQWRVQNNTDWIALSVRIISHVFMVQTWIPVESVYYSLNGLSWYLSTIQFCYLCFPLLYRVLRKLNTAAAAFLSLIAVFALQFFIAMVSVKVFRINAVDHYYLTYVCPLFRIFDFICGCLLAVVFSKTPTDHKSIHQHTVWEILAVFAVGITQYIALNKRVFMWGRFSLIFLPASCFAILVFAIGGGYISKIFTAKIVKSFAALTPFVFLIHNQIITAVGANIRMAASPMNKYVEALVSFAVTILLSYLYLSVRTHWVKRKNSRQ